MSVMVLNALMGGHSGTVVMSAGQGLLVKMATDSYPRGCIGALGCDLHDLQRKNNCRGAFPEALTRNGLHVGSMCLGLGLLS